MQGVALEAAFYLAGVLMFRSGAIVYLLMDGTPPGLQYPFTAGGDRRNGAIDR